jgi:uncharacterized membrane protein YccC
VHIDRTQQLKEAGAVLRELSEILIYHIQGRLEHRVQDRRNLRRQERLKNDH